MLTFVDKKILTDAELAFIEELDRRARVVQQCPYLMFDKAAYTVTCGACKPGQCKRRAERGRKRNGEPLALSDRPACGAKTRAGEKCRMKIVPGKTKCRLHGGLSTGPKTQKGREKIRAAQLRRWAKYREENEVEAKRLEQTTAMLDVPHTLPEPQEPKRRRQWRPTRNR